jgi:hypothetical protein
MLRIKQDTLTLTVKISSLTAIAVFFVARNLCQCACVTMQWNSQSKAVACDHCIEIHALQLQPTTGSDPREPLEYVAAWGP